MEACVGATGQEDGDRVAEISVLSGDGGRSSEGRAPGRGVWKGRALYQ